MISNKFERILTNIFSILAIVMFSYLFLCSLFKTGINSEYIDIEYVTLINDNVVINLLRLCIFLIVGILLALIFNKIVKDLKIALIISMILSVLISIFVINSIMSGPQADQKEICEYAHFFNQGNYYGFVKGEYLSLTPHQLGMITIMRLVFYIFGDYNYQAFQYINAVSTSLIVLSGYMITKYLSNNNNKAMWIYLILNLLCIPMYLYTAFVYGEILSTVCILLATWLLFDLFGTFKVWKAVIYGLLMALSIMLRTNCYIALIAHAIVLIIKLIQYRKSIYFVLLVSLIGFTLISQASIKIGYSKYEKEGANAIPSIMYIVMGLNDTTLSPGWFDGYNHRTFKELDCNVDIATERARNDLVTKISEFIHHPRYALYFFNRKLQTQWNSPMYQCIHVNSNVVQQQNEFGNDLYFGKTRVVCEQITKTYQLAMYGFVLFILLIKRKEWKLEYYSLLIVVFGGFLFSIIWEAKTRYVFPYLLMMVPYFAIGLSEISNKIILTIKKRDFH